MYSNYVDFSDISNDSVASGSDLTSSVFGDASEIGDTIPLTTIEDNIHTDTVEIYYGEWKHDKRAGNST